MGVSGQPWLEVGTARHGGCGYSLQPGREGRLVIGARPAIDLVAHTLVIVPRGEPLRIEAPFNTHQRSHWKVVDQPWPSAGPDKVRKFVAGDGDPQVMLICGYFHVSLGASTDLF